MPAGRDLIEHVARALDPVLPKTARQVWFALEVKSPKPTVRAVRYAIKALIAQGRAKREAMSPGDLVQGRALLVVPKAQQAAE